MGIANKLNHQEYVYDFAVQGGAIGSLNLVGNKLPVGAVVQSASIVVETAFTSGGSATVSLGDLASATKYMAATAVASLTDQSLQTVTGVPNQVSVANEAQVTLAIAVAALTAGKLRVSLEYYMADA